MKSSTKNTPSSSTAKTSEMGTSSSMPEITHAILLTIVIPMPKIANTPIIVSTPATTPHPSPKVEPSSPPKKNPPQPKRKRESKKLNVISTYEELSDDPSPPPKTRKLTQIGNGVSAKTSSKKESIEPSPTEDPQVKGTNSQEESSEPKKKMTPTKRAIPRATKKTKQTFVEVMQEHPWWRSRGSTHATTSPPSPPPHGIPAVSGARGGRCERRSRWPLRAAPMVVAMSGTCGGCWERWP
ncbi:flocculation protein FLO11-like [Cryptomeria japonica]|uniref:flocculation protein FLO11-like n=1 Tax=Cryptomeria japonica TaxID=3369 RepID=UPI0027DA042D|nr:flocculation protein FLO11-like [Cryptomeria japonica]